MLQIRLQADQDTQDYEKMIDGLEKQLEEGKKTMEDVLAHHRDAEQTLNNNVKALEKEAQVLLGRLELKEQEISDQKYEERNELERKLDEAQLKLRNLGKLEREHEMLQRAYEELKVSNTQLQQSARLSTYEKEHPISEPSKNDTYRVDQGSFLCSPKEENLNQVMCIPTIDDERRESTSSTDIQKLNEELELLVVSQN